MELFVNLVLVLLLAWLFGAAATRLGYPAILGELAAGVIFGPPLLGLLQVNENIEVLAEIGVFLLLLYIGMEVNYKDLLRVPRVAWIAALIGFAVPLGLGIAGLAHFNYPISAGIVVGMVMGITSLTVLSRILVDLKMLGSRISNVMIAGSLIADTLGLILFGIYLGVAGEDTFDLNKILLAVAKATLFFGIVSYLGFKVFPLVGQFLKKTGFNERRANFTLVIVVGLIFALLAELAGLHSILGAFLAGLFLRGEVLARKLSHEVTGMVHDIALGFLAPIFFVMAGFHVDLSVLIENWPLALLVLGLALVGKTLGTFICFIFSGAKWRESLVIGIGMNIHGAVEIIIAEKAWEHKLIGDDLFSIVVLMAFFTTAVIPIFLKKGVGILKKRGELAGNDESRRGVLIVGAPALARTIAKSFKDHEPVCLIDSNVNRCRAAEADGLNVMRGNALQEEVLDLLDAGNARVFIAATANEEVNEKALDMARHLYGIADCYRLQQEAAVKPEPGKSEEAQPLFPALYESDWDVPEWISRLARKETEPANFTVEEPLAMSVVNVRLKHMEILPLVVERGTKRYMPAALEQAEAGDVVIGLRHIQPKGDREDPFERLIQHCSILDLEQDVSVQDLFFKASHLLAEKLNRDSKDVYRLLVDREKESSTVIVPGLAIPHIMIEGSGKTEILLARCREGITFFGQEDKAKIIFFIIGTRDERNIHLRILSAIAQLFQDPAFEDSLLTVEDPEEMREVILTTERRRF